MTRFLTLSGAAIVCLAFFGAAGPAAAKDHEFCKRDITEYGALACSFDTMAQCLAMQSGRGGDCLPNPFPSDTARSAYAYAPIARKHHQK